MMPEARYLALPGRGIVLKTGVAGIRFKFLVNALLRAPVPGSNALTVATYSWLGHRN